MTEAQRELARYVESLQGVIDKTDELSETEKALNFLRFQGAQGQIPQVRELVLGLAKQVDETKRVREEQESLLQISKALAEADRGALQARDDRIKGLIDATPTAQLEKSRADIALLTEEFQKFVDTAGRAGINESAYLEAVTTRLGLAGEEVKKTKSMVEELGLTFQSAFEDAIVGGKGLQDVLKGVAQDILRMTVRKTISDPFSTLLTASLGKFLSFDGGGYTGGGARSGGVDGKGGFLSVLHPQETVVDHTKGQRSGGGATVVNNFSVGDIASLRQVRKMVGQSQQASAAALQRSQNYGGSMA